MRLSVFLIALMLSGALLRGQDEPFPAATEPTSQPSTVDLKFTVSNINVSTHFTVYIGGGTNIQPPDSVAGNAIDPGNAPFRQGVIGSKDGNQPLISLSCNFYNPATTSRAIRPGDILLRTGNDGEPVSFAAIGIGEEACGLAKEDRQQVLATPISLAPGEAKTVTFVFKLVEADARQATISVTGGPSATFDVPAPSDPAP